VSRNPSSASWQGHRRGNSSQQTITTKDHDPSEASPLPTDPYVYDPLPYGEYFRLLRLLPGAQNEPLRCELFIAEIKEAPRYEALSYVWGDLTLRKRPLQCGKGVLMITRNLKRALLRMRFESKKTILWADAVCINQMDNIERGHQVDLMARVYANASKVQIWLGQDETGLADEAFNLIQDLNSYCEQEIGKHGDINKIHPIQLNHSLLDIRKWVAVKRLFYSPWFYRVWVLQEVGLAATGIVFWGASTIQWSRIVEFACLIRYRLQLHLPDFVGCLDSDKVTTAHDNIWCAYRNGWSKELLYLRGHSKKFQTLARSFVDILSTGRSYLATTLETKFSLSWPTQLPDHRKENC
jgi:hypothetical protein